MLIVPEVPKPCKYQKNINQEYQQKQEVHAKKPRSATKKPRNATKKPRNTHPIQPMQTTQDASMCSHALDMHIPHGTSPLPTPQ